MIGRAARAASGGLTELLLGLAGSTGWWFEGVCAQTDPEVFFPEKGGSVREAKAVCARCPVRAQCLAHALAHGERYGVWGGLSEPERRRLKQADAPTSPSTASRPPAPAEVDEVVVARLVAGHPVTGVCRDEVAQAAIGLHRAGVGARQVATRLGVTTRQVERWLARYRGGQPLCPRAGRKVAA